MEFSIVYLPEIEKYFNALSKSNQVSKQDKLPEVSGISAIEEDYL